MRFLLTLALLLLPQFRDTYYRELSNDETVNGFISDIEYLASEDLEGRAAGSTGEKMSAEYIEQRFASCDLDLLVSDKGNDFWICREGGDTLHSRNVLAFIEGFDPVLKNEYVVIGARLDNLGTADYERDGKSLRKTYYGANGNASGLAMLLALSQRMSRNRVLLRRSVIFAAFGATLSGNSGSWYFLNRTFADTSAIAAMVNLEMLGTCSTDNFYAYTSSNVALDDCIRELNSSLQPVKAKIVAEEPVNSNHRQFYAARIPSVMFTSGMYPEYNTERDLPSIIQYDNMERELEYLYNFSLSLCNGPRPAFRYVPRPARRKAVDERIYSYHECDVPPAFINSTDPVKFMQEWVYRYLRYPKEAVKDGIQGRVLVDFVINEQGKLVDASVVKGVDPLLDEEALRVISISPDWKPARVRGKKVKCEMSLYVEFRLERK